MAKKHKTEEESAETAEPEQPVNKNKRYRRDKPWDTDDIDQLSWKIEPALAPEQAKDQPLLAESSFAILFPKYRESYLRQTWGNVVASLSPHGINAVLDLVEGSMTVKTTRKTYDPYIIIKARDFIKLLARSVPFPQAVKVLEDGMSCEVVKISGIVRNKERFVKRRQRLVGPEGQTLKAIELLTQCYILVQGNTVSVLGPHKGIKQARKVILDCMDNIHPIYHIKEMMVRRQLAQDPKMADQDWSRFLPKFEKRRQKKRKDTEKDAENIDVNGNVAPAAGESSSKKTTSKKEKKPYTPFPPPRQPSKRDIELTTGDFFKKEKERKQKYKEEMEAQKAEKAEEKKKNREKAFIPVEEKPYKSTSVEEGSDEKSKKRKKREAKEEAEEDDSKRDKKRRKESKKGKKREEEEE